VIKEVLLGCQGMIGKENLVKMVPARGEQNLRRNRVTFPWVSHGVVKGKESEKNISILISMWGRECNVV